MDDDSTPANADEEEEEEEEDVDDYSEMEIPKRPARKGQSKKQPARGRATSPPESTADPESGPEGSLVGTDDDEEEVDELL